MVVWIECSFKAESKDKEQAEQQLAELIARYKPFSVERNDSQVVGLRGQEIGIIKVVFGLA